MIVGFCCELLQTCLETCIFGYKRCRCFTEGLAFKVVTGDKLAQSASLVNRFLSKTLFSRSSWCSVDLISVSSYHEKVVYQSKNTVGNTFYLPDMLRIGLGVRVRVTL